VTLRPPFLVEDASGAIVFAMMAMVSRLGPRDRIIAQVSADSGKTWSPVAVQGAEPGIASQLNVARVGQGVGLAWHERTPSGSTVLFNYSGDGGKSWLEAPAHIVPVSRSRIEQLRLRAAGSSVVATWIEMTAERTAIIAGASRDQGKTWQRSVLLGKTDVRPVTYDVELAEHNVVLITAERQSEGRAPGYRVRCRSGEAEQLWKTDQGGEVQTTESSSHSYPGPSQPEYLNVTVGDLVATVVCSLESGSPANLGCFMWKRRRRQ